MSTPTRHPIVTHDLERIFAEGVPWEMLDNATIFITGASGLVASYLVEALLYRNETIAKRPARIVASARNIEAARARFAAYAHRTDLQIIHHDASTPIKYASPIQYIVHAAGNATPSAFGRDPIGTYAPNVLGTHHVMERAHTDASDGVLFLSSGAVHGALTPNAPILREDVYGSVDPLDARSSYAESKRMGETICRSWWTQHGVPVRMARLGHTYGPGMRRSDERAFAQFVFSALDGNDIVLNSEGSAVRHYSYLADTTVALALILLSGANGEAYLVANTSATCSILELAELVASLAPNGAVSVRRSMDAAPPGYVPNRDPAHPLDISKIRRLGWVPHFGLQDGFHRTIESYR